MTIQYNTDNSLTIHEGFKTVLDELLTKELSRFGENITRLEVHLSDENGHKEGLSDKNCNLEARLKGMDPVMVSAKENTHELSVKGAVEKLKNVLESKIGRLKNH